MAICPGANVRLLTADKGRQRLTIYNRVNVHIAASNAASLYDYFNKTGRPDSHFYVRKDGTFDQYVDTAWRANADYQGNDATISFETQGVEGDSLTAEQKKTIAYIYKWARQTHGIKNKIAADSKIGESSHGLSWHRLGIDGNFPALPSPYAGRLQRGGGMRYSTSRGKTCPTNNWIDAIPEIYQLSQDAPAPVPTPTPTPPPNTKLVVDGKWGKGTTTELQKMYNPGSVDGIVSGQDDYWQSKNPGLTTGWEWVTGEPNGSQLIFEIQAVLKNRGLYHGEHDALVGPKFFTACQQALGTPADGTVSSDSLMVREIQERVNAGQRPF